jgi:hypothetical protein
MTAPTDSALTGPFATINAYVTGLEQQLAQANTELQSAQAALGTNATTITSLEVQVTKLTAELAAAQGGGTPPPAGKLQLGYYSQDIGSYQAEYDKLVAVCGPAPWLRAYFGNGVIPGSWPGTYAAKIVGPTAYAASFKPLYTFDSAGNLLPNNAQDAAWIAFLKTIPAALIAEGKFEMAIWHEPSQSARGWTAPEFGAVWKHNTDIARATVKGILVGAVDMTYPIDIKTKGADAMFSALPQGADAPAFAGWDGYEGGASGYPSTNPPRASVIYKPCSDWAQARWPGIPQAAWEFGVNAGVPGAAADITQAYTDLAVLGFTKMLFWSAPYGTEDYTVEKYPGEAAAIKALPRV